MLSHSFSVSGIEHERCGSLDNEYSKEYTRPDLREKRSEPLLIINIFDLYEKWGKTDINNKEKALIQDNVPFFSLSFPGSFEKPKFKPLKGFVYNKKLQEKLRTDIREQEESSNDMEDEDEYNS